MPPTFTTDDLNQLFSDWSVTVTLREVVTTFDPQTQQAAESYTDTQISAIRGSNPTKPTANTAAQSLHEDVSFVVKTEDLPEPPPSSTRRVIHDSLEYDVIKHSLAADQLTQTLTCRRIT